MYTYAEFRDGKFYKIITQVDELSAEVMAANNLFPFVQDDVLYDPETHKEDGREVVIIDGVAHQRSLIVPKNDEDYYKEALELREAALPDRLEMKEFTLTLLSRLIDWVLMQADPNKPESVFQISQAEITALDNMVTALKAAPLPESMRDLPEPTPKGAVR